VLNEKKTFLAHRAFFNLTIFVIIGEEQTNYAVPHCAVLSSLPLRHPPCARNRNRSTRLWAVLGFIVYGDIERKLTSVQQVSGANFGQGIG
jgi:hypothetical protein